MNMSRAVRKQLLGCDLIQGVLESVPAAYAAAGEETSPEVRKLLFKLQRATGMASRLACQSLDVNGKWQLDDKATKQYARALIEVQNVIRSIYGKTVNAIDFIKACQVWVEDLRNGKTPLPVHPVERRIVWREIADLLEAIYLGYDPEREADQEIDAGMAKGERFKEAAGCW